MSTEIFNLPVFPPADVFPMMADDELRELADDIKENGLREPLVIGEITDEHGELTEMLVDGRNRRSACKIAGVKPEIRKLNGEDPTAYVLSANIHRRHMTKGQRAMVVAILYPEPDKGGRGKKGPNKLEGFSKELLTRGRTILQYAKEHVGDVLSGAKSLDEAYQIAKLRKEAESSEEVRLENLRSRYPELADKVVEGELTLPGAVAEANERDAQLREQRRTAIGIIKGGLYNVGAFSVPEQFDDVMTLLNSPSGREELLKAFDGNAKDFRAQIKRVNAGFPKFSKLLTDLEGALK